MRHTSHPRDEELTPSYVQLLLLGTKEAAQFLSMPTQFLSNSVTAGTARSYSAGIKTWTEYLGTLDGTSHPGEYPERVEDQNGKA